MTTLTPGERLIRSLLGEPVDHISFGVGFGWFPWRETYERWEQESGQRPLDFGRELGGLEFQMVFGLSHDDQPRCHAFTFPYFERQVLEETEETITFRNEHGVVLRDRKHGVTMPQFLEYPVKTPVDWERLKAERLNPYTPGRLTVDWDVFRARQRETGEAVQVGWPGLGVFGTVRDLMGAEEVLIAFYEEPEMIRDMMDHLTTLWLSLWEQVAAEVQIDHLHIWEDMAGKQGSLISPAMVEEFMMPQYDRLVEFARAHGVRIVSVDTDGDCSELVPIFLRHGVNMMFPFEVQAGCDIREFRRQYPELSILGGLDKRALAGTKADVDGEIEKVAWMFANGGRYVPSFDHLIPPDASWENTRYAALKIKELCWAAGERTWQ